MTKTRKEPGYLALHRAGTLRERSEEAWQLLAGCTVCPHACGVNRLAGELGLQRRDQRDWLRLIRHLAGE